MGAKMVTQTAVKTAFLTCAADADCYVANTNLTVNEAAATTDANKKLRCCMRTELIEDSDTTAGKAAVTTNKGLGYASEEKTYTKICNYGYAAFYTSLGTEYVSSTLMWTDASKNQYKLYCDGGAQALAISAAAATAVAISMY